MHYKQLLTDMMGYSVGVAGIALSANDVKNIALGFGGLILLALQIWINVIRLRAELRKKNNDNTH